MTRALTLLGALATAFATLDGAAAQLNELPEGPNRDLVSHECQACHDLSMLYAAAGMDRVGWSSTIDEMLSYALRVTPEEQAKILEYLSNFLGPQAGRKPAAQRARPIRSKGQFKMIKYAFAAILFLHGTSVALGQTRSTASGVFTAEQAKNGERVFQAQCAPCHGTDLHSICPEAPDLTDGAFNYGWKDKTIAYRFQQIRSQMPPGAARSLDDQTYLDIIAYILQFNGIPTGSEKLAPDVDALERIVITIP